MSPTQALGTDEARYRALLARDARFDGSFFTGVTSTGIYCRPVCRVRTPRRENCQFFEHAAQAEGAGFRPCLRCRPELAPQQPIWSMQDASSMLAQQAARLLDEPEAWGDELPSVPRLAQRLGVSDRHVRRLFESQFGVSPLQYLQTRRLLTAKQLLTDTQLPVADIAIGSGYASVRRFNAAFLQHYGLNPSQLRKQGAAPVQAGTAIKLGYRPPYDVAAMLGFYATRHIDSIEFIELNSQRALFAKGMQLTASGRLHTGWLQAEFDVDRHQLKLRVSDGLREVLPQVIRRVRACFDLDADPIAINQVLHRSFPFGDGLRVPGTLDGFELAVRAVLGQQITVAAARTLTQRLVNTYGGELITPWPALSKLFPTAGVLARAQPENLGALGIVRQRQTAIIALAQAMTNRQFSLQNSADLQATVSALMALPGIGEWTAQYIAMRALRWPDAFPAGDVALHKALGVQAARQPAQQAEITAQAWRPWRSYAVIRAWASLPARPTESGSKQSAGASA